MNITKRKHKLIQRLKDKQHREAFVSAQIDIGIPFQIRALREQRNETQAALSSRTGLAQAWISTLENINYKGFSLKTLKKVASIFDVGLVIRFVPISQLVEWELNLSNGSLLVPSFNDEPYFKEPTIETQAAGKQDRSREEQEKVLYIFDYRPRNPFALAAMGSQSHQRASFFEKQEKSRESAIS
jgi:transcriptional regulator with XRE-family HTH domain